MSEPESPATPTSPRPALVTGATRGIGRAVALALSGAGIPVAACSRTQAGLDETVALARAAGGAPVVALPLDVGDLGACAEAPDHVAELLGAPAVILVHCAAVARPGRIAEVSLTDWEDSMRINTTSAVVLARAMIPAMQARRWGRIVTIGSLYSRAGSPFAGPYAASKHALLGLTRVLATELIRDGVTANCIIPGWTDTEMVAEEVQRISTEKHISPEQALKGILRNQPLRRMVAPEEVGALAAYLCSDAAAPITAQGINIDGGSQQA